MTLQSRPCRGIYLYIVINNAFRAFRRIPIVSFVIGAVALLCSLKLNLLYKKNSYMLFQSRLNDRILVEKQGECGVRGWWVVHILRIARKYLYVSLFGGNLKTIFH